MPSCRQFKAISEKVIIENKVTVWAIIKLEIFFDGKKTELCKVKVYIKKSKQFNYFMAALMAARPQNSLRTTFHNLRQLAGG